MITGIEKSMDKVTKEVIALQNKIANKVLETQLQNALEDMGKDDSIADTIREKHFSKGVPVTYGDLEDRDISPSFRTRLLTSSTPTLHS
ncbi:hypothetical protein [Turicimonas sp. TL08]